MSYRLAAKARLLSSLCNDFVQEKQGLAIIAQAQTNCEYAFSTHSCRAVANCIEPIEKHLEAFDQIRTSFFKHYPTLPSRLIPSSFCASTANSIGSCFSTSRAKPFTISATAASESSPRDWA